VGAGEVEGAGEGDGDGDGAVEGEGAGVGVGVVEGVVAGEGVVEGEVEGEDKIERSNGGRLVGCSDRRLLLLKPDEKSLKIRILCHQPIDLLFHQGQQVICTIHPFCHQKKNFPPLLLGNMADQPPQRLCLSDRIGDIQNILCREIFEE
jgi:hypothetical protein